MPYGTRLIRGRSGMNVFKSPPFGAGCKTSPFIVETRVHQVFHPPSSADFFKRTASQVSRHEGKMAGLQHLKIPLTLVKRSWLTKSPFQAKDGIMSDLKLLATILYRMPEPPLRQFCCRGIFGAWAGGNQEEFHSDVALYFSEFANSHPAHTTVEKGHGRVETREYRLCTDIGWLEKSDCWKGLKAIGMVKSTVYKTKEQKETVDRRYYITSLQDVEGFAYSVRKHWSIENQLHWNLDVIFREDENQAKKDNSPKNLNILRKCAMRLLNDARSGRETKKIVDA